MKLTPSEPFNDHLDACARCLRSPFDLCPEGKRLLEETRDLVAKHLQLMSDVRAAQKNGGPQ